MNCQFFRIFCRALEAEGQHSRAEAAAREALKGMGEPPCLPPRPWLVSQHARALARQAKISDAANAVETAAEDLESWIYDGPLDYDGPPDFSLEVHSWLSAGVALCVAVTSQRYNG